VPKAVPRKSSVSAARGTTKAADTERAEGGQSADLQQPAPVGRHVMVAAVGRLD